MIDGITKYFLGKVNTKRLILTVLAVFVYIFVSDFIIHGVLLGETYKETAHLWRPEEEMKNFMPWMMLAQLMIAKFFSMIFVKGYENRGIAEGVRFGFLMSGFGLAPILIQYAVSPIPGSLIGAWIALGLIQTIGAGIVASLTYKK